MATITKQLKTKGELSYRAQVRVKRGSKIIFSEGSQLRPGSLHDKFGAPLAPPAARTPSEIIDKSSYLGDCSNWGSVLASFGLRPKDVSDVTLLFDAALGAASLKTGRLGRRGKMNLFADELLALLVTTL